MERQRLRALLIRKDVKRRYCMACYGIGLRALLIRKDVKRHLRYPPCNRV